VSSSLAAVVDGASEEGGEPRALERTFDVAVDLERRAPLLTIVTDAGDLAFQVEAFFKFVGGKLGQRQGELPILAGLIFASEAAGIARDGTDDLSRFA
jgi:hypothetical protein